MPGLVALLMIVLLAGVAAAEGQGESGARGKKQKRPNVIVVMTDDQDADSVRVMTQLQRLVAARGVSFENSFVSYPLCCPSRATQITGQYSHNHHVISNLPPSGGYAKLEPSLGNTLPVWMQAAGYYTGHIGKFLNGYRSRVVPPGWSEWYGAWEGAGYYGYTLNENGVPVHYGTDLNTVDPPTYQTDVYSAKAADFVRRRAPSKQPFFLSIQPFAPHWDTCNCAGNDPRAAPRHEGAFANEPLPKNPSYNEADVSDKPKMIRQLPLISAQVEGEIRQRYRARLESLLAVDDLIANLVNSLARVGELKRTVIIFTSDNGYTVGDHRWVLNKYVPYEPSIRVPLIMRGPGVPRGRRRNQPIANIDLAPTILAYAKAKPGRVQDGRALQPLLRNRWLRWGRGIVLESFYNQAGEHPGGPRIVYRGLRTDRYAFVRHETGEEELYDLRSDPFELRSLHRSAAYWPVRGALDRLLANLQSCEGPSCGARPALKLRLSFERNRGCAASGVRATLAGGDAANVVTPVRFRIGNRKVGQDRRAPFRAKVRAGKQGSSRGSRITALVSMLDGREVSVSRRAPRSCAPTS